MRRTLYEQLISQVGNGYIATTLVPSIAAARIAAALCAHFDHSVSEGFLSISVAQLSENIPGCQPK